MKDGCDIEKRKKKGGGVQEWRRKSKNKNESIKNERVGRENRKTGGDRERQ